MDINIIQLVVICIIAGLAWFANDKLNNIPTLKGIIQVLIVVVAVLLILQSLGIMGNNMHLTVR